MLPLAFLVLLLFVSKTGDNIDVNILNQLNTWIKKPMWRRLESTKFLARLHREQRLALSATVVSRGILKTLLHSKPTLVASHVYKQGFLRLFLSIQ